VCDEFDLEDHHRRLLQLACEAWDRGQRARELVEAEGVVVEDRYGRPKAHPAVNIQRDAEITFARLVRELALDADPPSPDPRLPRPGRR
jgi:P27 family predicted phage terminase small subunit